MSTPCNKPNTGGCAFRGAKMALQPICDAAHLVHGPVTCEGLSWDVRPGVPWVEISHERRMALSGYGGLVNLAGRIHTALRWPPRRLAQARTAPWRRLCGGEA